MKFIDRLLLLLAGLVFIAFAGLFAVVVIGVVSIEQITAVIQSTPRGWLTVVIMSALVCLLLFVGIKLLFMRPRKDKIQSCLINNDEDGEIFISVSAIDNIVKMAILSFPDVKNLKVRIKATRTGVVVFGKIFAPVGINTPELLTSIKSLVKQFVEEKSGICVDQIRLVCVEAAPITVSNRPTELPPVSKKAQPEAEATAEAEVIYGSNEVTIKVEDAAPAAAAPIVEQDDTDILLG
ncbi:MAG: alkaline shock response membrane anchor protein AmaP [Clostridiales bacterium]|nr:alkaline shock response membrane anchor protein AmaP [Clostridiales bacterium]